MGDNIYHYDLIPKLESSGLSTTSKLSHRICERLIISLCSGPCTFLNSDVTTVPHQGIYTVYETSPNQLSVSVKKLFIRCVSVHGGSQLGAPVQFLV